MSRDSLHDDLVSGDVCGYNYDWRSQDSPHGQYGGGDDVCGYNYDWRSQDSPHGQFGGGDDVCGDNSDWDSVLSPTGPLVQVQPDQDFVPPDNCLSPPWLTVTGSEYEHGMSPWDPLFSSDPTLR